MKLDGEIIVNHGVIDTGDLLSELMPIKDSPIWHESNRNKIYKAHSETDLLELLSFPSLRDENVFYVWKNQTVLDSPIGQVSQKILKAMTDLIPGTVIRAGIVRLYPGKQIYKHIDGLHPGWTATHRVHLPIITEPEVEFFYENARYHMPINILAEVNNIIPHGVDHNGKNLRYHMMCDILPKSYQGDFKIVEHSDFAIKTEKQQKELDQVLKATKTNGISY
jgi:hypothetical protein